VNGIDGLAASDMELCAPGPSYTADTLTRFRETSGLAASQIFFITGADAFAEIATWHRYPEVLDLANFVVVSRPGFPAQGMRDRLPSLAGRMVLVPGSGFAIPDSGPGLAVPGIFLIDASTPDVSSTEVRRRLAAGETLNGLVPVSVGRHIRQHALYTKSSLAPTANHLHGEN
jgi:nicotinate-nucleotide adenylyltransferase